MSFIGTSGGSFRSDMAIDHIEMTPGTCGNPGKKCNIDIFIEN